MHSEVIKRQNLPKTPTQESNTHSYRINKFLQKISTLKKIKNSLQSDVSVRRPPVRCERWPQMKVCGDAQTLSDISHVLRLL